MKMIMQIALLLLFSSTVANAKPVISGQTYPVCFKISQASTCFIPIHTNVPQARIDQLHKEIADMLTYELGMNKNEAEKIISTARYLTPSGRDINKVAVINSKLSELQMLEAGGKR